MQNQKQKNCCKIVFPMGASKPIYSKKFDGKLNFFILTINIKDVTHWHNGKFEYRGLKAFNLKILGPQKF